MSSRALTVSYLLLLSLCSYSHGTRGCEDLYKGCSCENIASGTRVICSSLSLKNVPRNLPADVDELHLNNNLIQSLSKNDFHNIRPTKVYLSNNYITFISPDTFQNMSNLEVLDISKNRLNFSSAMLHKDVFSGLTALTSLDISGNYLFLQTIIYPDYLFKGFTNLKHLVMDGINNPFHPNGDAPFGPGFAKLTSLESLTLYSNITHIGNTTLAAFANAPLKNLTIWSGWLDTVESHCFAHFPFLEVLDLSYNPRLGFESVSVAWPGLEYTNISSLILRRATSFETSVVTLTPEFFIGLNNTRISTLILEGNHIVTTHGLFSEYLPHLKNLSLSRNRLVQVNALIQDLGKLEGLVYLDVSHQAKRMFITEPELLAGFRPTVTDNSEVISANNPTVSEHQPETLLTQEGFLDNHFDFNDPSAQNDETSPNPFYTLPHWELPIPSTLEYLLLSGSLTMELENLPKTILLNSLSLRLIDYSGNGLSKFDGAIIFMNASKNPLTMDLSDNGCGYISDEVFGAEVALSIEHLLMSKNNFNDYLNSNQGKRVLSTFQNIKTLDYNDNAIKALPTDLFKALPKLETLLLANNALRSLPLDFQNNTKLQHLDIANNVISTLPESVTNQLQNIAEKNSQNNPNYTLQLNLVGNPLGCSCNTENFVWWIKNQRDNPNKTITFVDFDSYSCFLESEEKMWADGGLEKVLEDLKWRCNRHLYIILGAVLSGIIVIVIGLSICIHRHKWEIRFWCIHMVIRKKEETAVEQQFIYDAFVAFHESSLNWIKTQMIPKLEHRGPDSLKLCIHHRDFEPGGVIQETILQSIKNSRKTILLVTEKFVESSWCYFEMQMAQTTALDDGRDIIIAVLMEPISRNTKGVSNTLMKILRKQTYIVWPRDKPDEQRDFWHRLDQAIRSKHDRPTYCECGKALTHEGFVYKQDGSRNKLPRTNLELVGEHNATFVDM